MAKFEWRIGSGQTLDGWPMVHVLYAEQEILRYASLIYEPHRGPKGTWVLRLRDWEKHQDIEEAQICAPPKEFVESLVLLSYDIGGKDGW
jgi:hypothetical protein